MLTRSTAVLLLLCTPGLATTVIVLVTPEQIVAGSDRLIVDENSRINRVEATETGRKTVLLRGKFAVSCVGIEEGDDKVPPHRPLYSFLAMMRTVEAHLRADSTFSDVLVLIEKESSRALTVRFPIEKGMRNGDIRRGEGFEGVIVQYVIAGYESATPRIVEIRYSVDWQKFKLIGPERQIDFPSPKLHQTFLLRTGVADALNGIPGNPNSYAMRRVFESINPEWQKLAHEERLTSAESIKIARTVIGIEAEAEPSMVGNGATIALIPHNGKGSIASYGALSSRSRVPNRK